jgi:ParB family chromosome partitioning protein
MPKEIAVGKLKPHPRNVEIYGEEDVSDLVAQIEERGRIVMPIIINKDNVILSGHRRWGAAQELKYKTVPCEIREFESPEDELEFLLHSNVSRKKTKEQMAREGIVLLEVLSVQSAERRNANLKQFKTEGDDSSHTDEPALDNGSEASEDTTGRTRDEVAKALRIGSGKQFDRMKAVVTKIDELKGQGKLDDAALYGIILNRAPSAAYDLLEVNLSTLSDEDKRNLESGKVSPRVFTPAETENREKVKRETSYGSAMSHLKGMESMTKGLISDMGYIKDKKQKQRVLERIEKQISNLQNFLSSVDTPDAKNEAES